MKPNKPRVVFQTMRAEVETALMKLELQQRVGEDDDVVEVVEEIGHAFAEHVRHDPVIALGNRFQDCPVHGFIEGEHRTVISLQRVVRIRRAVQRRTAAGNR